MCRLEGWRNVRLFIQTLPSAPLRKRKLSPVFYLSITFLDFANSIQFWILLFWLVLYFHRDKAKKTQDYFTPLKFWAKVSKQQNDRGVFLSHLNLLAEAVSNLTVTWPSGIISYYYYVFVLSLTRGIVVDKKVKNNGLRTSDKEV